MLPWLRPGTWPDANGQVEDAAIWSAVGRLPRCGVDPAPHSQDLLDGHARTELAILRDRHARQVNSEPR
jgi:hypothetical protein